MASKAQITAFINLIAPSVQMMCKQRGWGVPSAIIAQAGKESAWGTSGLWKKAYNLCGQKWVSGNTRGYVEMNTKEQRKDGSYYTVLAKFVKYSDVYDGIIGYAEFVEKYKRYKLVMASKDYIEYANQLQNCGWATSLTYASSIISLVQTYGLTVYDTGNITNVIQPTDKTKFYCPGQTYTTQVNLYIRDTANGNKIKFDGLTKNAKENAYFDNYGYSILRNNTKVTCKEVKEVAGAVWIRIPSGWVCAINNKNEIYIK